MGLVELNAPQTRQQVCQRRRTNRRKGRTPGLRSGLKRGGRPPERGNDGHDFERLQALS
jgi:hypothetical protein